MAVPEPLIRKQLLQNTVPEIEQGQQMEQVWIFSYRSFWNAAWVLLQKMSQGKGQPGGEGTNKGLPWKEHRDCELSVWLLPWGIRGGFTLPGAHSVGRSQISQEGLWDQVQNSEFSKVMPKKQNYTEHSAEVQAQAQ